MTSVSSIGPSVAGYNYTLVCTVTLIEGMLGAPNIWWTNTNGRLITSSGDIILHDPLTSGLTTTLTLYFDPIRTTDEGTYNCMASVSSPALATPLNSSTAYIVNVLLSKSCISVHINKSLLLNTIELMCSLLLQPIQSLS